MQNYEEVFTITFSYGQKHVVELESARKIVSLAGVENEILELGAIFAGLSSLTDPQQAIPAGDSAGSTELPSTFVPGRNILFLSLAGSRAYVRNCDTIVTGVSQADFAGYPDCRAEFIANMESTLSAGLDRKISIVCPLMHLTKAETVELADTLPGCMEALSHSTTCYNGAIPPCGACNSCQLRAKGFAEAGVVDPLIKRLSNEGSPAPKVVADAGR
jgi:queuosine biosynthesis protein QueC